MEIHNVEKVWNGKEKTAVLFAALLGVAFDQLFYRGTFGISVLPFVILFYIFYFRATGISAKPGRRFSTVLFAAVVMLTLDIVVYANQTFRILNVLALPALIVVHTFLAAAETRGDTPQRFIPKLAAQLFPQTFSRMKLLFLLLRGTFQRSGRQQSYVLRQILLGLLISAPLLVVVGTLLGSADALFQRMLGRIPDWFAGLHFGEWLFRAVVVLAVAGYAYGFVMGLAHPRPGKSADHETGEKGVGYILDSITVITVLILVNSLFVLFVAIQFSYLFAGGSGSLPNGLTYADYIHKGFAELNVVSLINLTLLIVSLRSVDGNRKISAILKALQTLLAANSFVMLASAYIRLALYEEAYGFTVLRLLVHAFMLVMFILFVWGLIRIWRKQFPLVKMWLATGILAYALVASSNIEGIAASLNVARFEQTGKLDAAYLAGLSNDAAPAVMRLSNAEKQNEQIAFLLQSFRDKAKQAHPWQELTLSDLFARKFVRDTAW
ncbi:MAG TPA: DUF4173 domain-containing protein [Bacilli bacterium]